MMALPVDANNAYKFMDYMMRPEVAANNVNYVYMPAVTARRTSD